MRITEVAKLTESELFEAIDKDNDTEYSTQDLTRVAMAAQNGQWSKPMSGDQLSALLDSWTK